MRVYRYCFLFLLILRLSAHPPAYNPLTIGANFLLDGYKKLLSPLQGKDICFFSPTCSRYAKAAINRYNFFWGLIMTADRLERCNPSALLYAQDFYSGEKEGKIFDPPERHFLGSVKERESVDFDIWLITLDTFRFLFPGEPYDLAFADFLYTEKEFSLALAEYLKIKFWTNDERIREYAKVMSGECYSKLGNYGNARKEVEGLANKGLRMLMRGRVLLAEGKYDSARSQLFYIKDERLKNTAQFLYGLSYLYEGNLERFFSYFPMKNLSLPKRKSPLLSGLFSFLLPGAGQVYTNRAGDGLYSLFVVGTLAGISYHYGKEKEKGKFWFFLSLTSLFHLGNIYGAVISAYDYNRYEKKNFIKRWKERLQEEGYPSWQIDLKGFLLE
ncbi:MAG: membrane protein insertion efficiency factor YidD [candidate division WOR-3 bacterium]